MRTTTISIALVFVASTGCKWTDFDDLETETWVESTEKPDGNSNDYGIAMQRSVRSSADGGTLVVMGAGQALYTELSYKPTGGASLVPETEVKLNTQFGIGNLDNQPIVIADSATDEVALVTNSGGNGSIAILAGTHTMMSAQVFGPTTPDGAVYFKAASQTATKVFVASEDSVYGFAAAPAPQPKCQLVDETATPLAIRGITGAKITSQTDDDLVVWAGDGKLYLFAGTTFDGCTTPAAPIAPPLDLGFAPLHNASMQMIDATHLLVGGHHDNDAKSIVALVDLMPATPVLVGTPLMRDGLKAVNFLDVPDGKYVIAGFPNESVDGTVSGEVLALPVSMTTGIDPTPKAILHDAQPEGNQAFGRALAILQYNGKPTLAVAASNEIFFYYQSPLYGETRRR
jgi:hypothetical protein